MKTKHQYTLLFGFLLISIGVLLYFVFEEKKEYFIGSEVILLILIVLGRKVYKNIFQPIELMRQGKNAISDEDFNVKFMKTGAKDMDELIQVYNQMIDKIRIERTFQQEQHYFLDLLIEALPVSILILDYDDNISEFNPKAEHILGLTPEVIGRPLKALKHPLIKTIGNLDLDEPATIRTEGINYYRCFANKFMHRGFPRKFIVVQELSGEILATEKKAFGKVIRMMAHEVNNTIGAVNSILDSISSQKPIDSDEALEYLPIVINRNQRLNEFMRNFAKVVRLPEPELVKVELNTLVSDLFQLMKVKIDKQGIDYKLFLPEQKVYVMADKEQLEQVLINIIKNSSEAIEGSGEITVYLAANPAKILVTDTGKGLSADASKQVFTPFFSTKQDGQGIGLTLVREILYNHQAEFSLTSNNGLTTFEIQF